jgi:hypothetical protein
MQLTRTTVESIEVGLCALDLGTQLVGLSQERSTGGLAVASASLLDCAIGHPNPPALSLHVLLQPVDLRRVVKDQVALPERGSPKSEKGRRLSSPGGIRRVARATRRRCRWAGSDGVRAWGQVVLWTASIRSRPAATKAPTGLANVLAVGAVTLVMSHLYSHNTSWG